MSVTAHRRVGEEGLAEEWLSGGEGRLGWWCDEALREPCGGLPVCVHTLYTRTGA